MHTERDVTRIVRSWLRLDEHVSADRVLDSVIARLDATPQRRSWWPARRITEMNNTAKLAVAAVVVVVVVVVAMNRLPSPAVFGGPSTPTAGATAQADASPTPEVDPIGGYYSIGRHSMTVDGVTLSFDVAAVGWEPHGLLLLNKSDTPGQEAEGIIFAARYPAGDAAASCNGLDLPGEEIPAPVSAAVANAVARAPGTTLVASPSDVTVGGRAAKHVVVTVSGDAGCDPGYFYNWHAGRRGAFWQRAQVGDTIKVWIVEVPGGLLFIAGETHADASPALGQEIEAIVESIRFE